MKITETFEASSSKKLKVTMDKLGLALPPPYAEAILLSFESAYS